MGEEVAPGVYRHYKGGMYRVIGVSTNTETGKKTVVYRALKDNSLWDRPLEMFLEEVEVEGKRVKRFSFIEKTVS